MWLLSYQVQINHLVLCCLVLVMARESSGDLLTDRKFFWFCYCCFRVNREVEVCVGQEAPNSALHSIAICLLSP